MRFAIFLFALHFFQIGNAQSRASEQVLATELNRFDAMTRKDTPALQNLLADDMIYLHSNNVREDKRTHIAAISSGKMEYKTMERTTVQVRCYGKMAITNGNVRVKGAYNGTPFDILLAYSATYKKHRKIWQLLNWQSTRIP